MVSKYLVYALKDPITNAYRFVGISRSGINRPQQFRSHAVSGKCSALLREWILSIKGEYAIEVLEELPSPERLEEVRQKCINILTSKGHRLIPDSLPVRRRTALQNSRAVYGDRRKMRLFEFIMKNQPCSMNNQELGEVLGVSSRQISRYIQDLVEAGAIVSDVQYRRGMTQVLTSRRLAVVESFKHGNPIQKSAVRSQEDAVSWFEPAELHPADSEDL